MMSNATQTSRTLSVATLAVAAVLLVAVGAEAQITRLTAHPGEDCIVAGIGVNTAAELQVAFESTCDLVGTNADGNREIFLVDAMGVVAQWTDTTDCANTNPALNGAGDVVMFESDCDTGTNADRSIEIYSADGLSMTQLTDTSFCTNLAPSVNQAGTLVSFDSDCDFTVGNLDGSVEIFQLVPGGAVTQITDDGGTSTGCASINAASDSSGDAVAFESDCDLIGTNSDQISEIFQYRSGVGVVQLTSSLGEPCINATPSTSADGMSIAFSSDCDLVGGNVENNSEIFVNVRDAGDSQLTTANGEEGCESLSPSIVSDGTTERVVFAGYCDLLGGNGDASYEIYRAYDGAVARLTDGADCASISPKLAGSGEQTVFLSNCDLAGSGANGLDIYVSGLCACGGPISRSTPTATDALLALQSAVALVGCALCDCDVNDDTRVTASDALLILNKAVGADIELTCP